jgi:DNA-binding ferritin-like protein
MAALVENIVALEKEADSIVERSRAEGKTMEKNAAEEVEAYRRKMAEETDQKISAYHQEMEKNHGRLIAQAEGELNQALQALDQIGADALKNQILRIVTRFSEL